ncbi:MAG TPA: ATP-binding protein, partial [Bacteroidota bacterium]|nr:ATP-binding protein [Bacteroidota bacterium]
VRDLDECIIFWNSGAAHLYGWQSEEVLGKSAAELFFKETPSKFDEAKKVLLEKGEWQGECTHLTKDGREIAVNSHWTLVKDQAGKPKSILVINTDITEQKRLQAQFLRSQRMESVGTLAGGIAHDLNNILAPILLSVEILRNKVVDGSALKMLDVLESSAKRGAGIIKQILTFARGTQGEKTSLQPKYLVSEIEKMISDTFPRSIQITTKSVKHPWIIQGDPTQLYQVLMNLCVNARDAMPNGGVLNIETDNVVLDEHMTGIHLDAKPGSYVVISVSDAGMGIPASVIDKIFEPFFTTKEIGKGTGLGLSTVIGIVKSHGGFVTVYSEINKGTRFKVYLPATDTKESEGAMDDKVELPKGKGELVLVVDDEDAIRDIQKRTLEAHGYSVLTARDGTEAIVKYSSNQEMIEVVVTDMMMPYMDGVATIRAIRRLNPAVKFIGMSGLLEGTDYNKVVGGDVIFLQKPYTTEKFLTTLNEVINQA